MKQLTAIEVCFLEENTRLFVVKKDETGNWQKGEWMLFTSMYAWMDMNYAQFIEEPLGLDLEDYCKTWKAFK